MAGEGGLPLSPRSGKVTEENVRQVDPEWGGQQVWVLLELSAVPDRRPFIYVAARKML
jgi:hypothetical protein